MLLIFFLLHSGFKKKNVICFLKFPLDTAGKGKKPLFIIKYYKIKIFSFSDVMEENVKKQITFFFLNPLWRRKNISDNLTLSHF